MMGRSQDRGPPHLRGGGCGSVLLLYDCIDGAGVSMRRRFGVWR